MDAILDFTLPELNALQNWNLRGEKASLAMEAMIEWKELQKQIDSGTWDKEKKELQDSWDDLINVMYQYDEELKLAEKEEDRLKIEKNIAANQVRIEKIAFKLNQVTEPVQTAQYLKVHTIKQSLEALKLKTELLEEMTIDDQELFISKIANNPNNLKQGEYTRLFTSTPELLETKPSLGF
jgi:hypothetical protein